ncbi:MAG: type I DNA topoisomerase [Elusimicrobiota bacterium]
MKNLVIVESPTKQKTISRFLPDGYIVKSSFGHIRDLPAKELGVAIEKKFEPKYVVVERGKKIIPEIAKIASSSDNIYLATDPDREGEAISWHITEILKNINYKKFKRIVFHEITKSAILQAIKNPRDIDMNLVNAQQARRILDRIVGYKISPLLWKKIKGGLSAGRVQSVAVRLIYERDKEIKNFELKDYYTINGRFEKDGVKFDARLFKWENENVDRYTTLKLFAEDYKYRSSIFDSKEKAASVLNYLSSKKFSVIKVESKTTTSKPKPPFITSTLQQEAYTKLGFSADRTMKIAQKLYEGVSVKGEMKGLITYMRTDSFNVSEDLQKQTALFIKKNYGENYCPQTPPVYSKKVKGAQEAHESIHPTDVNITPESIKNEVSSDEYLLYDLIWKRFVASQMENALFDQVTVEIEDSGNKAIFRTGGRTLKFDGYLKVYSDLTEDDKKDDENNSLSLPPLKEGDKLSLVDFDIDSHTTTPPPNYNEASLIKTLENHGIGRPSTYAMIITTIIKRGYVKKDKSKKMLITELGRKVTEKLIEFFPDIMSLGYTAEIEDKLDDIADGNVNWISLLENFYSSFKSKLDIAFSKMKFDGIIQHTNVKCKICGSDMILRESRYGKYLVCSKFPKCKGKINLDDNNEEKFKGIKTTQKCEKCKDGYMILRKGPKGYFLGCSNFPKCRGVKQISQEEAQKMIAESTKEKQSDVNGNSN